jgi:hypothetical protein
MSFVDKIKSDFTRHRKKAMVLAGLAVVMCAFIAKAYFDMAPRNASADASAATASPNHADAVMPRVVENEENARQSRLLWKTLREKRGIGPDLAFTFVYEHFNRDPNRKQEPAPDRSDLNQAPKIIINTDEMRRKELENKVLAASRNLVVRSTVVGVARPVAVISDQTQAASDRILAVGDHLNGFKITAIRAREVEFEKDGITVAVEMARSK